MQVREVSLFSQRAVVWHLGAVLLLPKAFFTSRDWLKHNARQTERHRCFFFMFEC